LKTSTKTERSKLDMNTGAWSKLMLY